MKKNSSRESRHEIHLPNKCFSKFDHIYIFCIRQTLHSEKVFARKD